MMKITIFLLHKKPYASWTLNVAEARWQSPIGDAPALSEEEQTTHRLSVE